MIDFSISKAMFELFPKLNVFAFQAGGVQGVIPALDARTLLTTVASVSLLFMDNTIVSALNPLRQCPVAVVSLLAATMALISVQAPPTLIIAASNGA